ncbi:MAG: hypothetical protein DRR19_29565 [Candidatus Parabeggiatoa sp. nov. 1]|nr:MAG: hypothetical protein DRR19_29565 [Gammaproteobacteria bacterium]
MINEAFTILIEFCAQKTFIANTIQLIFLESYSYFEKSLRKTFEVCQTLASIIQLVCYSQVKLYF